MSASEHRERIAQSAQQADYATLYLSTDDLPDREKLAIWHELHGRTLFNLGMTPQGDTPFRSDANIHRINEIAVATVNSSPVQYYTDRQHLQNAQDSVAVFTVRQGRAHGRQKDRETVIGPGEGFAILNSETAAVNTMEGGRYTTIYVPRNLIAPLVPNLDQVLMRPTALNNGALKLLMGYAGLLQDHLDDIDPGLRHGIAGHLSDLMAHVLGACCSESAAGNASGLRVARLQSIHEDIQAHLTDHDLSAEVVAKRQGVSARYIRKLLDSEGTTFSDLVLRQRLIRAHRLLTDPRQLKRPIGLVAYDTGFGDLSYFNRCFKRQFGKTPSDIRALAARQ